MSAYTGLTRHAVQADLDHDQAFHFSDSIKEAHLSIGRCLNLLAAGGKLTQHQYGCMLGLQDRKWGDPFSLSAFPSG